MSNAFDRTTVFLYQALAIVNMLAGISGATYGFIMGTRAKWPFDKISCLVLVRGHYLFLYQSALILCCISVDRCLMITLPLRYPSLVTAKRAKVGLFCLLLMSLCSMIPLIPIQGFPLATSSRERCAGNPFQIRGSDLGWVGLFLFLISIPLLGTTTANVCMMRAALRHRKRIEPAPSSPSPSPLITPRTRSATPSSTYTDKTTLTVERSGIIQRLGLSAFNRSKPKKMSSHFKTIRTTVTMTVAYYLSWIPISSYFILQTTRGVASVSKEFYFCAFGINLCACWWNIIFYVATNTPLRNAAKALLKIRTDNTRMICMES